MKQSALVRSRRSFDTVWLAMLSALWCGCARRVDPLAAPVAQRNGNFEMELNHVYLLDPRMQRSITVEANGARRTATNTLEVYATFRSRLDDPSRLVARTRFFDADQRPLEETQWTTLFVERRGLKNYAISSTRPDAAFYLVEVQLTR